MQIFTNEREIFRIVYQLVRSWSTSKSGRSSKHDLFSDFYVEIEFHICTTPSRNELDLFRELKKIDQRQSETVGRFEKFRTEKARINLVISKDVTHHAERYEDYRLMSSVGSYLFEW